MDKRQVTLDVLATVCELSPSEITDDQNLVADLGIDSPRALRLLVELEDQLELEIPDEDAAKLTTVGDVVAYVEAH